MSASAEDAVPQSDARTKLEVQVAALEAAVSVLNRLAEGAAQYAADQQARIGKMGGLGLGLAGGQERRLLVEPLRKKKRG